MGSALALSSQLGAVAGWRGVWLAYAALALAAALGLFLLRERFLSEKS
jgi:predicted MFS family arabinose efflux permease